MVPGSAPVLTCHPFVPWPFVAPPCPTQWQTWAMAGFMSRDWIKGTVNYSEPDEPDNFLIKSRDFL